jgi:hypothetical protein
MNTKPPAGSRAFDDPIRVADCAEMLILAANGERPLMFADIVIRQALHAGKLASAPKSRRGDIGSSADLGADQIGPEPFQCRGLPRTLMGFALL